MKTLRARTRVGVTVPDPDVTLFMMIVTHDVWFRSFRDELSLNVKYFIKSQESHVRFRRKFSGNVPVDTARCGLLSGMGRYRA